MIPEPIFKKLIAEALQCLLSGEYTDGQLLKFKNSVKLANESEGLSIRGMVAAIEKKIDVVKKIYIEEVSQTYFYELYGNFFTFFTILGEVDYANHAASAGLKVVNKDNINDLKRAANIAMHAGFMNEHDELIKDLRKLNAEGDMIEIEVENYEISASVFSSINLLVRKTLVNCGIRDVGTDVKKFDADGIATLVVKFLTNIKDENAIAFAQKQINYELSEFEIANDIDISNVLFMIGYFND